jgi:hypothetical protein
MKIGKACRLTDSAEISVKQVERGDGTLDRNPIKLSDSLVDNAWEPLRVT